MRAIYHRSEIVALGTATAGDTGSYIFLYKEFRFGETTKTLNGIRSMIGKKKEK